MSAPAVTPDSCKCGAPIIWTKTTTGKAMPVDAYPSDDGNVVLERVGPTVLAFVYSTTAAARVMTPAAPLHKSHFATCPDAASFRRKGEHRVHGG